MPDNVEYICVCTFSHKLTGSAKVVDYSYQSNVSAAGIAAVLTAFKAEVGTLIAAIGAGTTTYHDYALELVPAQT